MREAEKGDIPTLLELIQELAVFEGRPDAVSNTPAMMERDGFGPNPLFKALLAEDENCYAVGMALYYFRYSTWKGPSLFLEDLIVREAYRGLGIGRLLFEASMQRTLREGCTQMNWQVLDWNQAAVGFYQSYGASIDEEWWDCGLSARQIRQWEQSALASD